MEKMSASKKSDSISVKIKKEPDGDEIKEYAETAMNELLGWYGYDARCSHDEVNRLHSGGDSSEPESPRCLDGVCGWCSRQMEGVSPSLTSTTGAFCSELCFSQSRRASFKRNKMCDWCRHVRHTVSYVDFQDGARQLQFCSDKCLNQYKMQIFCRETRAHLELHPHLHRTPSSSDDGSLITPDLWLRDCRDDAHSPVAVTEPSMRRKASSRKNLTRKLSRNIRTATVTSESTESPQDLRVRPRSPALESSTSPKSADDIAKEVPTAPMPELKPSWPPPITVLVPYPILIPVPLPIPIPLPVNKFKEAFENHVPDKTDEEIEVKRSRTLRRRKRVTDDSVKNRKSVSA